MIEVRRTAPSDAEVLRTIRLASLSSDPTAFGRTHDEVSAYGPDLWVERATGSDTMANFLATQDGRAVGLVAGVELPDAAGRVELAALWTEPAARARGVGQQLVNEVVRWAIDRGTPEVRLWVTQGNDAAVRLYARCGFELTDETGVSATDPCRNELRMMRRSPM